MDYSFRPYLEELDRNWYRDDALLRRLLERHRGRFRFGGPADGAGKRDGADGPGAASPGPAAGAGAAGRANPTDLEAWGGTVSGPLRRLAETSARPENRPRLRHRDAYGRRVDEVVLPDSTLRALREVEGREGLGAPHGDPFDFYARVYLCQQNGEAGVACSMACTDGLVRALEALGDRPEHEKAVERVRGSDRDRVWHGAQFVTERQGGSDVPAIRARAERADGGWRIRGEKWFCSNVNADYFLVAARPEGAPEDGRGVGLFLVPAYREGDELRNGHTIERLKEKLGTRELATAEVTFDGALGWPVGPLERGLPNLVRHVLVPSRFGCVISAAAFLRRAERIVDAYTEFRTAFGRPIGEYPLVARTVDEIRTARAESLAAVFRLLELWERAREDASSTAAADFRVLLSLCKPVLTRRSTRLLHEAMMLLGGQGIEEEFSPLPRLHRDAVIMETWEGPHDVLHTQALKDLHRLDFEPGAFVERHAAAGTGGDLAAELSRLLDRADDPETTVPFAGWARRMVRSFARRELEEADAA